MNAWKNWPAREWNGKSLCDFVVLALLVKFFELAYFVQKPIKSTLMDNSLISEIKIKVRLARLKLQFLEINLS